MSPAPMMMSAPSGAAADYAANDLITRLVDGFGMPSEPVYLRPAPMMDERSMAMDTALRNASRISGPIAGALFIARFPPVHRALNEASGLGHSTIRSG